MDTTSSGTETWLTLLGAIVSTLAITRVWGPLARWLARRFDLSMEARNNDLTTCRQEIAALRIEYEAHRRSATTEIRDLSSTVATLTERTRNLEEDVQRLTAENAQLRRQRGTR